jgi:hypothetical protein
MKLLEGPVGNWFGQAISFHISACPAPLFVATFWIYTSTKLSPPGGGNFGASGSLAALAALAALPLKGPRKVCASFPSHQSSPSLLARSAHRCVERVQQAQPALEKEIHTLNLCDSSRCGTIGLKPAGSPANGRSPTLRSGEATTFTITACAGHT